MIISEDFMPYSFSVWLDDETAAALENLTQQEDRKRGAMIKVLIRRAAQNLSNQIQVKTDSQDKQRMDSHIDN